MKLGLDIRQFKTKDFVHEGVLKVFSYESLGIKHFFKIERIVKNFSERVEITSSFIVILGRLGSI